MKLRSFYSILIGAVVLLLLSGLAGAYWLTSPVVRPASAAADAPSLLSKPTAAMFISRQSAGMVSLLTNPDQLAQFWLSGEASDQPVTKPVRSKAADNKKSRRGKVAQGLEERLAQVQQALFDPIGLNYERDLKTWLGNEVTFALMTPDVDRDPANGDQAGYLLVLAVRDPGQAQTALEAFWQRRSSKRQVQQVAGVEVVQAEAAADSTQPILTSALVGSRYVLFANYPQVLRAALTNAQAPELNLESSFAYQQALEQFPEPQLGLLYLDLTQSGSRLLSGLSDSIELGEPLASADPPSGQSFDQPFGNPEAGHLIASFKSTPQGLLVDTALMAAQPADLQFVSSQQPINVSPLLRFIPARSRLAMASQDFSQTWSQWQWLIGSTWKPALLALQQRLSLPLPDAAWMEGKFALAEVAGAQSDWVLVTQESPAAAAGLLELDRLAQQQGMSVGSFQLQDQTVYAWTKLIPRGTGLEAAVQGVHTQITDPQSGGDYQVLATSLEALEQALASNLAVQFQQALAQIRPTNQGYLYFDRTALKQVLTERGFDPSQALLNPIQSALLSSYGQTETGWQGTLFLSLDRS